MYADLWGAGVAQRTFHLESTPCILTVRIAVRARPVVLILITVVVSFDLGPSYPNWDPLQCDGGIWWWEWCLGVGGWVGDSGVCNMATFIVRFCVVVWLSLQRSGVLASASIACSVFFVLSDLLS